VAQIHTYFNDTLVGALTLLEKALVARTFLATERVTLADLTLAAELQLALTTFIDASTRASLPNVLRHFETVVNQPAVREVFGSTSYADKALQYAPPPKEKKPAAAAAEPKPKAEKKPKVVEADDDDDDGEIYEEPKGKSPLDLLPKSSLNLEDWKRAYSNKETRGPGGAIEWFYQKCVPLKCIRQSCAELARDIVSTRKVSHSGVSTSSTRTSSRRRSCRRI
jgi:elongation factor 1-gamma